METIRMNLLLKGDRETAEAVKLFADSFRIMMDDDDKMTTIRDELNFIKKYFMVQKYRYEDKIDLIIEVDSHLLNNQIPKFLLQPLIENALYHGLEMKGDFGRVTVSIEKMNKWMKICVADDGVGMDEHELYNLSQTLKDISDSKKGSYALRNIAKRLILLYGDDANLDIQSKKGCGTKVIVLIPVEKVLHSEGGWSNVESFDC